MFRKYVTYDFTYHGFFALGISILVFKLAGTRPSVDFGMPNSCREFCSVTQRAARRDSLQKAGPVFPCRKGSTCIFMRGNSLIDPAASL